MSGRYPSIRHFMRDGHCALREGLVICFFMRRSHGEIAHAIRHSMETYRQAVGPQALNWYVNFDGSPKRLDGEAWSWWMSYVVEPRWRPACTVLMSEAQAVGGYEIRYHGVSLDKGLLAGDPTATTALAFLLPTEFLEEHGPGRVRELALALAGDLPFNSGHVSLSLNYFDTLGLWELLLKYAFRYPGMDIADISSLSSWIGTQVKGAHWLTFLGQPVLGQLGGVLGLRARLSHPEVSIEELPAERALITLGEWPEAGDAEAGQPLPLHRALARVLEPYLYHAPAQWPGFSVEDMRRWERRFLD